MTAPPQRAGAALLYLLAIPVALHGRGAASRGRGSSRWRTWPLGRGSSWRRGARRRTRRSASLWLPPSEQIPRTQRPLIQKPPTRRPWTQTPLTRNPGAAIGQALARLPRPGRAAAARREMEEAVPEVINVL
jgi:hypothetical protein